MKREKREKEKSNFGVAFITIENSLAAQNLIASFNDLRRDIKEQDRKLYDNFEVYVI